MKTYISLFIIVLLATSCTKDDMSPAHSQEKPWSFAGSNEMHPRAGEYQSILDTNQKLGLIGASLMIRDEYGLWMGTAGMSDVEAGKKVETAQRFHIASITKVFTAATVFSLVDKGVLSIDDPVSKWIRASLLDKLANGDQAKISHLLSHTSGIADYYTLAYDLDRMNAEYNNWSYEEILAYAYKEDPTNEVGETFYYSNTNFLLLGMILESATGKKLEQVYEDEIFTPLNLESAYFSLENPIPEGCAKGYGDLYGNGQFVHTDFMYKDELGTADGGISINAYDTGLFFEKLMKGHLLSEQSLAQMTDWFELPPLWGYESIGLSENGYGIEKFTKQPEYAVGHTGSIMGFSTLAQYFPEPDFTYVLLVNSASYEDEAYRIAIYDACMKIMF
jgi:D-alanyl-D-alanine carboxypeptidase